MARVEWFDTAPHEDRRQCKAKQKQASWFGHGGEDDLAGGVEVRQVPGVRAGDREGAGGRDAGPVEEVERAADLAGDIDIVSEREFQRAAERDRDSGC